MMSDADTGAAPAILLVDDEPEILFSSGLILESAGMGPVRTIEDSREVLPYLAGHEASVIVLDLQMPHLSGRELLRELADGYPHIPVIIVTAANELETAVSCMKLGAFDYLVKPIDPDAYLGCIGKGVEVSRLRREISLLREALNSERVEPGEAFWAITTRSPRMRAIFSYVEGIAPSDQPVLITGETGAGKELMARAIHQVSGRSGEFMPVNIAGLDETMVSDTLFGHRKGAFTGAVQNREGMIARAAGGTLFLDEIGDLSLPSQIKLLRLVQENEFYPLGADSPVRSSARVVVATNRELRRVVEAAGFRKDLYFRLSAHQIHVPRLQERQEDIPLLLELFLDEAARSFRKKRPTYPPELLHYLRSYHFPGNVRELRAMVFEAVACHKGGVLAMTAFKAAIGRESEAAGDLSTAEPEWLQISGRFPTLKEMEHVLIAKALAAAGGNQGAAAALLGISRQALNKRLLDA